MDYNFNELLLISKYLSFIKNMNILTTDLLKLIDKQRPAKPNPETILQAPANMFGIIRQMYNSFKKDNQSRILQNKIYELKIYQSRRDAGNTKMRKEQGTPVKLQHLFQSNTKNHTAELIHNLMILKTFLELDLRIELIEKISKQVSKLDDLATVLKLYKKLLKAKECINDKALYKLIQREMIAKVLSLTSFIPITKQNMSQISIFLLSLPYLQIQVLQLISCLFEKVKEISDFDPLKLIYSNIYQKVSEKEKISNEQNKIIMQSLLKITSQEHIISVRQKANSIINRKKNKSKLADQTQIFLKLLQQQSIKYMVSNYPILKINANSEEGSGAMEEQNLNEKEKKIVDLIFVALETQLLIELVGDGKNTKVELQAEKWNEKLPVLNIFIGWYHNCCKNSTWDVYISEKMIQLTEKLFQFPHSVISLIKILLEREAGYHSNSNNISNTIVNLSQSVSKFMIHQLLSNLAIFNRYLNNKYAKQIVAYGLMNDQFDIYEQIIINPTNLDYIDILLETFSCPSPIDFYKRLLGNQVKRANFQKYLSAVLQEKQKKYKDFFKQVDSYQQGQIFEIHQHCLLKYFRLTATSDIVLCFFRDMTMYLPSKLCIEIMKSFIQKFKPKGEHKIIYSQAVRTLNIILSTRNAAELSVQFKMHLKQIVQLQIIEAKQVFKNVPIKMTDDLTLFYTSSEAK